jgi:hypothetical protein
MSHALVSELIFNYGHWTYLGTQCFVMLLWGQSTPHAPEGAALFH